MPITGKFEADFSDFNRGTKEASDNLKSFDDAAHKSADSIGDIEKATDSMLGVVGKVAGAFGIGFSVSALVSFIDATNQQASALQNLSIQTRIGVEDLQVLQGATKDFGINSDQLGNSLYQLSRRIFGGDANVASAYAAMGISMDQIRAKAGNQMELLLATEQGLASLRGEIQATASSDLYGGKLGANMIAFAPTADAAVAAARGFVKVAGTDAVKAAADMATEVDRAKASLGALVMEWEGKASRIYNILTKQTELAEKGNAVDKDTIAGKTQLFQQIQKNATLNTELTDGMTLEIGLGQQSNAVKTENVGKTQKQIDAETFLNTMRLNTAKPLLDYQQKGLDQLKESNQLTAQNAERIGVTVNQFQAYQAALEKAKQTEQDRATALRTQDAELLTIYNGQIDLLKTMEAQKAKAYDLDTQIQMLQDLAASENIATAAVMSELDSEKDRMKVREDNAKRQREISTEITALRKQQTDLEAASILRTIDLQTQLNKAYGLDAKGAILLPQDAMSEYQKKIDNINASMRDGVEGTTAYREKQLALAVAEQQLTQALNAEVAAGNAAAVMRSVLAGEAQTQIRLSNDGTYAAQQHNQAVAEYNKQLASLNDTLEKTAAGTNADAIAWAKAYDTLKQLTAAVNESATTLNNSIGAWKAQDEALNHYKGTLAATTDDVMKFNAQIALMPNTGTGAQTNVSGIGAQNANMATTYAWAQAILSGGQVPVGTAPLPGRAAGGPVSAGESYVVGERGPELFTPSASGAINPTVPSGRGGVTIVVNGSVLSTQAELAALVEQAMVAAYRRGGNRLPV